MTAYTPIYNLPYVEPSDLVASYPTVSEELAENVETALSGLSTGALTLIHTETFSNVAAATASQKFSNTYTKYLILINTTGNNEQRLRWREDSGSDITTNYEGAGWFAAVGGGSGVFGQGTTNTSIYYAGSNSGHGFVYLDRPSQTAMHSSAHFVDGAASLAVRSDRRTGGTNITGMTVFASGGNISGNFSIYGYTV